MNHVRSRCQLQFPVGVPNPPVQLSILDDRLDDLQLNQSNAIEMIPIAVGVRYHS